MARRARSALNDDFVANIWPETLERAGPYNALKEVLGRWAEADARPLVLLIDEIDSLIGDTLLSVLRQLRAGYDQRPSSFPQSVVLCGVRDVRDYRIQSAAENAVVAGGSAFNIKSESLRLGDFSPDEVETLLAPTHRGDGTSVRPGRQQDDLDAHPRPAVAGECARLPSLLQEQGPGPRPAGNG